MIRMLRENKRTLIVTSIVTILPILAGVLFWNRLPDLMATHFGIDNEANGFSSKPFAVFGIPLFCLLMLWVLAFVTSSDPRKKNISPKLFALCLWIIPVVSLVCAATIYPYNLGISMDISRIMMFLMGFMFIVIGNYMPKIRRNYTIGIKIPWTLDSETNWNRTHRFSGFLWVIFGILMIFLNLLGIMPVEALLPLIILITIIPCIYSYLLYKRGIR